MPESCSLKCFDGSGLTLSVDWSCLRCRFQLHWSRLPHYCVLERVRARSWTLLNAARGIRKLTICALSRGVSWELGKQSKTHLTEDGEERRRTNKTNLRNLQRTTDLTQEFVGFVFYSFFGLWL